jgi:hypothetical protein
MTPTYLNGFVLQTLNHRCIHSNFLRRFHFAPSTKLFQNIVFDCRSDANMALDVMAENVSVCKAVTSIYLLGKESKNVVIRTNIARVMDSVINRQVGEVRDPDKYC